MKTYHGKRTGYAVDVTVDGRALDPRFDLWNHSPTGFEWGYGGSGPAQLALALLADHFANNQKALEFYQRFKFAVIAGLRARQWTLTDREIDQALKKICAEHAAEDAPKRLPPC